MKYVFLLVFKYEDSIKAIKHKEKPPEWEAFLFVTPTGFKPVTLRAEI